MGAVEQTAKALREGRSLAEQAAEGAVLLSSAVGQLSELMIIAGGPYVLKYHTVLAQLKEATETVGTLLATTVESLNSDAANLAPDS